MYDDGLSSVADLPSATNEDVPLSGGVNNKCDAQSNTVESCSEVVAKVPKENDHTGSTVSLNELLDSCMFDGENTAEAFADPDSVSLDPSGWVAVGDILGKQWMESAIKNHQSVKDADGSDGKTIGGGSSSDNSGPTTAVTHDNLPDFLLSIRNCYKRPCVDYVDNHRSGSSDAEFDGRFIGNEAGSKVLQHSNASSPGTARAHDDGYHSNATSATSPEVAGRVIEEQFVATR